MRGVSEGKCYKNGHKKWHDLLDNWIAEKKQLVIYRKTIPRAIIDEKTGTRKFQHSCGETTSCDDKQWTATVSTKM